MKQYPSFRPDRIETNVGPLLLAGLSKKYPSKNSGIYQNLWQEFRTFEGCIPGQKHKTRYGVCRNINNRGKMEYFYGVEVRSLGRLPPLLTHKFLKCNSYAVFSHIGHISTVKNTFDRIRIQWLPDFYHSGYPIVDFFFERYGEGFIPDKGFGDIEIWIPLEFN